MKGREITSMINIICRKHNPRYLINDLISLCNKTIRLERQNLVKDLKSLLFMGCDISLISSSYIELKLNSIVDALRLRSLPVWLTRRFINQTYPAIRVKNSYVTGDVLRLYLLPFNPAMYVKLNSIYNNYLLILRKEIIIEDI